MKKMISVILAVMMLVGIGVTANAVYETEEVPVALIEELLDEGFVRDEDDTTIWTYEEYVNHDNDDCDYMYMYAIFDTDENVGVITAYAYCKNGRVLGQACYVYRWNNIDEEMEMTAEFESGEIDY